MPCFKPAWDKAFYKDLNLAGWRHEGMIPFTRHALWRKRGAPPPGSVDSSWSWASRSGALSLTPPTTTSVTAASTSGLAPPSSSPPAAELPPHPLEPDARPLAPPSDPAALKEAFDYMEKAAPKPAGILDIEELVKENNRMREYSKIIADEFKKSSRVAEETIAQETGRITSRDIFGIAGSATGKEAMARLKAKDDEKKAAAAATAAKNDDKKEKKAKETASQVIAGSELLKTIQRVGPNAIPRLSIADLWALLVNADPVGSITKPKTKAVALEKVQALTTVQSALRHFNPPEPQIFAPPEPRINNISIDRSSFGSSGQVSEEQAPVMATSTPDADVDF
jgi:hypothetical protein